MLLGSMNYNNNLGFALTFLLAGIGIISIYHCHQNLADICVHFTGSQPVFSGEAVRFHFIIENQSSYHRAQLLFGNSKTQQEICTALAPGERHPIDVRITSTQRGWLTLPRLLISSRYPLGLLRAWAWINMDATEVIYPQPASFAPVSSTSHTGTATSGPGLAGDDDFSGLRNYRLCDPPKRIAWKALARTGDTLVTEYHGGTSDLVWVDWDDYPVNDPEKRLALLTRRALDSDASGNLWGLRMPDQVIDPDQGTTHRHQCLKVLALHKSGIGDDEP